MTDADREDGYYWVIIAREPQDPFILYWRNNMMSEFNRFSNWWMGSECCINNHDYIVVSNKLECPLKAFL